MKKYTLLLNIFSLVFAFASGQINHVEPLNWWVGMKDPNVQLLLNGSNIAETMPSINYPGVTIRKVTKGDSKNYLFIDLQIAANTKPGNLNIVFTKGGKVLYTHAYPLLKRVAGAASLQGFGPSDAIYLLVPDRFANGDTSNDVIPGMREAAINRSFEGARHGGDIRGIINHLDYLKGMGFTAIWPTPMLENDMQAYSYHGYSITNHYKVDPRFGTIDDYKELSAKARQRGIKLIFDEVLNHTGSNYWWMHDLPFANWLNYPNKYTQSNHRRTTNQDKYASQYDKDLMTNGWFDKTMPDMNGQNPFMANYLIQCSIWWIETLQLGGIRQDTYGYSDKTFLTNWSCRIMNEYPNFSLVGEEWSTNPLIESYWQKSKQNHDGYKSCLNTLMDFPMQEALVLALTEPEGADFGKGLTRLYEGLANDFVYANPNQMLVMGDNHDMDRLYMQLKQDTALTKMAIAYLLTTRGIPQIFYGTEVLMDNTPHHKNDGLIRSDFPGGWPGDAVNAFTGARLSPQQASMQQYMKHLLNWRKGMPVIASGKTLHFAPFEGIYVFFRYTNTQKVMVILNKNAEAKSIATNRFAEILKGSSKGTDVISGQVVGLGDTIDVAGKTVRIISIQ